MSIFTIRYHLYDAKNIQNERLLGVEHIENVDEILIPLNEKNTPFFITKSFVGIESKRWRVEFVLGIQPNTWGIWLSPKDISDDVYLSQSMVKRRINHAGGIVKKGTIVVVEFGHIYLTLNSQQILSDSSLYPCYTQSGEMHKRRPAIVVKADRKGVTVAPITSQMPKNFPHNKAIFELDLQSTQFIHELKNGKASYVLCEMLQTVSATRILPPYARDFAGKERKFRRNESYQRRLSASDMKSLDDGLLGAIGASSYRIKNESLTVALQKEIQLSQDIIAQIEKLRHIIEVQKVSLEELTCRHKILSELYLLNSEHLSLDSIYSEISEYL
ncbi:type II toxin-antitoxin system PemK/MazF family toxin [Providencia rettgeri]|uniref:type II toxin-antitoxin system PemK/MazF family toxin n=1 Tax=Providencia rettgeri TaxID=587 RepID=UPI0015EB9B76|nr:type II toxin-antitoxin system PemK/MazF family toxin [Providencia rettgeri]